MKERRKWLGLSAQAWAFFLSLSPAAAAPFDMMFRGKIASSSSSASLPSCLSSSSSLLQTYPHTKVGWRIFGMLVRHGNYAKVKLSFNLNNQIRRYVFYTVLKARWQKRHHEDISQGLQDRKESNISSSIHSSEDSAEDLGKKNSHLKKCPQVTWCLSVHTLEKR